MATGILDFTYTPYALGDAVLFVANIQSIARMRGDKLSELLVMLPPDQPSSIYQRNIITPNNYHRVITNLYPALLSGPEIQSVRLFHHWRPFNHAIWQKWRAREKTFPTITSHWRQKSNYWSFAPVLACHQKFNDIPKLSMPCGYNDAGKAFLDSLPNGRVIISLNIRQKANTPEASDVYRDSNVDVWRQFLVRAGIEHPEALFVLLGGYNEWERDFLDDANVVIPRTHGLGLGEELAILTQSKFFMGTNSGFAIAATLSTVPYVITSTVHEHSHYAALGVGDPQIAFARPGQYFCWESETPERLMTWFKRLLKESASA